MLLNELIKLISSSMDIVENDIVRLLNDNNIRLEQRLLLNKRESSKNTDKTLKDEVQIKRGRGRPRKKCISECVKDDDTTLEVELLVLDNVEYYKTQEDVILNNNLEIIGILKKGKIEKKEI